MKLSQLVEKRLQQVEVPDVNFTAQYDVIVVGLGTAGVTAALSAARQGCTVLGIERLHCAGGTGTAGAIMSYYFGFPGGLHEEQDRAVTALKRTGYTKRAKENPDLKKLVLDRALRDAGVDVRYESTLIGVYAEDKRVCGVRWVGSDGIVQASARTVIDCSGNADAAALAGCSFQQGRASDGKTQPFSSVQEFYNGKKVGASYTDHGYVDPSCGDDVTRAIVASASLPTHLKETYHPSQRLVRTAPLLGIREGRLIEAEEQVRWSDVMEDRETSHPIFYAFSNLDNHSKDLAFEGMDQQDWVIGAGLWGLNFAVAMPLGVLIPKGYDGILVAGRCFGIDHDISGCIRMKREMHKSGEAAGVAAALAQRMHVALRDVPYGLLAEKLMETGCLKTNGFPRYRDTSVQLGDSADTPSSSSIWLTSETAIREALASDKPGIAIWSARRLGAALIPQLRAWCLQTEHHHLACSSAFALALLDDPTGIPVLRQLVRNRDPYMPQSSRKYNQLRGYAAIYLLGRLQDDGIVDELFAILHDPSSFRHSSTDAEFMHTDEDLYFQYASFALMALLRIGGRHIHLRPSISRRIREIIHKSNNRLYVTLKGNTSLLHEMTSQTYGIVEKELSTWRQHA